MARAKNRNSNYLVHLESLIFEAADRAGIEKELAKELIDEFFVTLQTFLSDPRMPKVYIKYFGYFEVPYTSIARLIRIKIRKFRKGTYPRSRMMQGIKRLWPIYKRKQRERKRNKVDLKKWNELSPKKFLTEVNTGFYTELPENYYKMPYREWINFLKTESRFGTQTSKNRKLSVLYNSLRGRLIHIDKLKNIEQFFTSKGFDTFSKKQGRKTSEEEHLTKVVLAIWMDNFDWERREIINEEEIKKYNKKTIK